MTSTLTIHTLRWGRLTAKPGEAIGVDALRQYVPAIFADHPHAKRSDKYGLVSTAHLLEELFAKGFVVSHAAQLVARNQRDRQTARHIVRLQHAAHRQTETRALGEVWPEVVILNSHDGSTRFQMKAGLMRLACLNGLIVPDVAVGGVVLRHHQSAPSLVIDGVYEVLEEATKAIDIASAWRARMLTEAERLAFAAMARFLRLANRDGSVTSPIQAERFLMPRRFGEDGHDLWTTFNVIQENVIQGNVVGEGLTGDGRPRRVTTRPVYAIDRELEINEALWSHAANLLGA